MPTFVPTANIHTLIEYFTGQKIEGVQTTSSSHIRELIIAINIRIKRQRNLGVMQHYRYDLDRHIALVKTREYLITLIAQNKKPGTRCRA